MAAEAARHDPESARQYQDALIDSENQQSRLRKQHDALSAGPILDNKRQEEAALRAKVAAAPELQAKFGRAWDDTARAAAHERDIAATYIPIVVVGEELPSRPPLVVRNGDCAARGGKCETRRAAPAGDAGFGVAADTGRHSFACADEPPGRGAYDGPGRCPDWKRRPARRIRSTAC